MIYIVNTHNKAPSNMQNSKNNSLTRNSKKRGTFNTLFNHDLKNVFVHFSNDLIVNIKKILKLLIKK